MSTGLRTENRIFSWISATIVHCLERYSTGRRVLNMFWLHRHGFSVYAMRGGALSVDSVDSSAKAVTLTDANIHLNFPDDTRHRSHAEDAFKFLADMPHGAYDLIVLDPLTFAKHRSAYTQCFARLSEDQRQGIRQNRPGRHTVHIFVLTGHHPRTVQARGILG